MLINSDATKYRKCNFSFVVHENMKKVVVEEIFHYCPPCPNIKIHVLKCGLLTNCI